MLTSTNHNAVSQSQTVHADRLLMPLPTVTNANNRKWTDFAAILLPNVPQMEFTRIMVLHVCEKAYTNEKSK